MVKIGDLNLGEFPLLLAPMEDVSDPPFRSVCKLNGVDMMYTEFISADGLLHHAEKSLQKLDIYDEERPIGIQLFGDKIEAMRDAAEIADRSEPELIDINYGCPVKKVACKGAGAGLLRDPEKMQRMTAEIIKVVNRPVTVKTRLGWDHESINILEVVQRLQDVGVQALTIHARTRAQLYKGEADWTWIAKVKELQGIHIPIFGNGDIDSPEKALSYKNRFGVDGIMVGRAAIGYPWIFREIKHYLATGEKLAPPTTDERVQICRTHLSKSVQWKGERTGIIEMRRHYANYFKNYPDFKQFRTKLVEQNDLAEIYDVLNQIAYHYSGYTAVEQEAHV